MANQYKNKVVYGGNTLIDLSADTVAADKLLSGYTAHDASGAPITGTHVAGSAAVTVTEEALSGGGTAKHITAVDISNDTVDAAHLATGYTAHDAQGNALVGTMSGGSSTTISPLSVTANGTYTAPSGTAYSPVTVNVASGGGGGTSANQVNFIDYDGTVLYSYTAAEAQALTALPSNPSHSGLTAQGWNWSLSDAQDYVEDYGSLNIGQMYITDDGKTRLYITIDDIARPLTTIMFACSVVGGVTIDWGDNSATQTSTATARTAYTHNYAAAGDYVITLDVTSGTMTWTGTTGTSGYGMMGLHGTTNLYNCTRLRRVEIGSGVSAIGAYWFQYCYNLTSITIPSGVTSIGTYAFSACYNLASITIPSGVTSIGTYAFSNCVGLLTVTIPSSTTSIGSYAFQSCYNLPSVTIPSGVTSIGNSTFSACYNLTSVTIPSGVTYIGNNAFSSCYNLAPISIPNKVTTIGNYAFQDCYSLASLTIPDGVTSIGTYAFSACYNLASITIPSGVTSIGTYAFQNCYSLASLTIPDGVTSIGTYAFQNCFGIAEYHLLPTTPPTLSNANAFTGIVADCVIYVPQGCLEAYQTATNWSTYASYMQEEPT